MPSWSSLNNTNCFVLYDKKSRGVGWWYWFIDDLSQQQSPALIATEVTTVMISVQDSKRED